MDEQRPEKDMPFTIGKWEVVRAWEKVRANEGAPGVDEVPAAEFERT